MYVARKPQQVWLTEPAAEGAPRALHAGELPPRAERVEPDPRFWRPVVGWECCPFFGSSAG